MRHKAGGPRWRATVVGSLLVLGLSAGSAAAAAPAATTGPATAVGSTTATVTGTVDPGGQSTTWYVEYGTSTSYGSKTDSASAGTGTSAVSVSSDLTSLTPGATYHYRVVATNGSGTSRGSDAVFTTLVPPVATTGSASGITASSATLNATVDPNGRATTYYFEYGTSTSYGTKTSTASAGSSTSAQAVSAAISGLQPGQTYHFRLVATSDAGTSTGSDSTLTTSSAPAASTGDAMSVTPTAATLRGTVTPNGLSTTWWFEYGTSTLYGLRTPSSSAGSGTAAKSVAAAIKGLKSATTYHYRLVAQNSSGKAVGEDRTFTTIGPPAVQTGAAQGIGADVATLTGALDTHGRSTTWWFQYGTSPRYGKTTPLKRAATKPGTQNVTVMLTGLAPATTYHFRLVARSDAGTSRGSDAMLTTTGVTLTVVTREVVFGGRIRLSGLVPTHRAGEQVTLLAEPYGAGSFRSVATLLTGADGVWAYGAPPLLNSVCVAGWHGSM
jgi:phosphodiesterase/alkaline phosphatase D-like protein